MKNATRIAVAFLLFCFLFAILCACAPSEKMEKFVFDYLEKKYKGLTFEAVEFSQDKETSGRYKIHMRCTTTNVDFEIYHTSLITTDSYSVCYANTYMERQINDLLTETERSITNVADIQWLDSFEDGKYDYKFREVLPDTSLDIQDVSTIYRIRLQSEKFDSPDAISEVVQSVYVMNDILAAKGVVLDRVTYEFVAEDKPILFESNTESIRQADFDGLAMVFAEAEMEKDPIEILLGNEKYMKITYFVNQEPEVTSEVANEYN